MTPILKAHIKESEEELFQLISEGHEAVINHEEVEEYRTNVKSFLTSSSTSLLKKIAEGEIERLNKYDTTTGFNAQYNDQFFEAKGFHEANVENIKYWQSILNSLNK